jgi:hypothetical protein
MHIVCVFRRVPGAGAARRRNRGMERQSLKSKGEKGPPSSKAKYSLRELRRQVPLRSCDHRYLFSQGDKASRLLHPRGSVTVNVKSVIQFDLHRHRRRCTPPLRCQRREIRLRLLLVLRGRRRPTIKRLRRGVGQVGPSHLKYTLVDQGRGRAAELARIVTKLNM